MDKLKMESSNLTEQNIEKIGKLFPNALTEMRDDEGNLKKGINFEVLKQELSGDVIEGEECYDFTWVGKKEAIVEANTPIRKTLRPCLEESKDWESTENLYIEGDNLDVLKLLQESYLNSVKMIYIDPPYNTGKDSFVYSDNFTMAKDDYEDVIEYRDDEGNINFKQNNEANPRFHSDWCSMIYSRLKLAHTLLSEDGAIFISIDDEESHNLRKICDEIFGKENLLSELVWNLGTGTQAGHFTRSHEYIIVFAKNKNALPNFSAIEEGIISHGALKKISKANPASEINFPPGIDYAGESAVFKGEIGGSEKQIIMEKSMVFENGKLKYPVTIKAGWGMRNQIINWLDGKETYDSKGQKIIRFLFNSQGILWYEKERGTFNPKTVITGVGSTKQGSLEIEELFGAKVIDFPKPKTLIAYIIQLLCRGNDIMLDFFSGSATTAHAVMQLNAEDGGNRKYIMVQLPEICRENTEAYRAGYKNISEIGKERIRRAGEKIKNDNKDKEGIDKLDIGFRVLKVDSTNMKDIYYSANEYEQSKLDEFISNIKDDRTDLDLLYGVLLDWGLPISLKHDIEEIDGVTVHTVDQGSLIACFADHVPESVVREIAKRQPLRVVFRDSSFASSPEKINVEEIFKLLAPNTSVRVI